MKRQKTTGLVNLEKNERLLSAGAGLALVAKGLLRIPLTAVALVAAGGYLLYRGVSGHCWGYELLGINRAVQFPEKKQAQQQTQPGAVPATPPAGVSEEDEVVEASWESFPASDPPAWTTGRRDEPSR